MSRRVETRRDKRRQEETRRKGKVGAGRRIVEKSGPGDRTTLPSSVDQSWAARRVALREYPVVPFAQRPPAS